LASIKSNRFCGAARNSEMNSFVFMSS